MTADIVITAQGLGKKYIIGHQAERERYVALRDVLSRHVRNLGRTVADAVRGRPNIVGDETEEFWALRGVDFEIRRGDVVGVIGGNGAGKSTLLKVLSRITEPSEGRVSILGRVASLLEVGTGFHPELTGRENIFLNGAILGMSRAEIRRKLKEIVAFAGVEKFLDTPVKRYSSGMYVRLAFAVAAHLEAEILIIDEVLAVGDVEFQKKCLGKMQDIAGQGRTVLFVSHNMSAVSALCSSAILLNNGRVEAAGSTTDCIQKLLTRPQEGGRISLASRNPRHAPVTIEDLDLYPEPRRDAANFSMRLRSAAAARVEVNLFLQSELGIPVGIMSLGGFGAGGFTLQAGETVVEGVVELSGLAFGRYQVNVEISEADVRRISLIERVLDFDFEPQVWPGEARVLKSEWNLGFVRFPCSFTPQPSSGVPHGAGTRDQP